MRLKFPISSREGGGLSVFTDSDTFLSLEAIRRLYKKKTKGDSLTTTELVKTLEELNTKFNDNNKIRATDRSLFFSGLMIALKNNNFRSTYKSIQRPTREETATTRATILEAHHLNESILSAITQELTGKINNLSNENLTFHRRKVEQFAHLRFAGKHAPDPVRHAADGDF